MKLKAFCLSFFVFVGLLGSTLPAIAVPTPYEILKISKDASHVEIAKAYLQQLEEPLGECPICFESVKVSEASRPSCKCSNVYHSDCLSTWTIEHQNCPTCRRKGNATKPPELKTLQEAYTAAYFAPQHEAAAASEGSAYCVDSIFKNLSSYDKDSLKRGNNIARYADVHDSAWPELRYFRILDTSPETAAAIFLNQISKKALISSATFRASSSLEGGFIVDSIKPSYEFNWKVELLPLKKGGGTGKALFIPYEAGTLFFYNYFIKPDFWGAQWISSLYKKMVSDQADRLAQQVLEIQERTFEQMESLFQDLRDQTHPDDTI